MKPQQVEHPAKVGDLLFRARPGRLKITSYQTFSVSRALGQLQDLGARQVVDAGA